MIKRRMDHKHRFEVMRTRWPYTEGWGLYCPKCRTVIATGMSRDEAERHCVKLNIASGVGKNDVTLIGIFLVLVIIAAILVVIFTGQTF